MSFPDTIVLFILALLLFGPKKLPQIARQVGKALAEFKRASNEFKAQIESEISNLDVENHQILPPAEPPAGVIAAERIAPEPLPDSQPHSVEPNQAHPVAKAQDV